MFGETTKTRCKRGQSKKGFLAGHVNQGGLADQRRTVKWLKNKKIRRVTNKGRVNKPKRLVESGPKRCNHAKEVRGFAG